MCGRALKMVYRSLKLKSTHRTLSKVPNLVYLAESLLLRLFHLFYIGLSKFPFKNSPILARFSLRFGVLNKHVPFKRLSQNRPVQWFSRLGSWPSDTLFFTI